MSTILPTLRRLAYVAGGAAAGSLAVYRNDPKQLHFDAVSATGPLVRLLDPETAHNLGIMAAKMGAFPRETRPDPPSLATTVWGRKFPNPIGMAAGFDKHAEVIEPLLGIGFGFVEIGSVTPLEQPGNPKPRCFRLKEHRAVINRYGFNSEGVDVAQGRLAALRKKQQQEGVPAFPVGIIGVNLGKNKTSPDAAADYTTGVHKLGPYADYLVINISSPNTPGLRALQSRAELESLVKAVKAARDQMQWANTTSTSSLHGGQSGPPPLLVKIAPDLTEADKKDIAAVAMKHGVDGLIISNTTIERPGSIPEHSHGKETGGLSGAPLFEPSTAVLRDMYKLTKGTIPIIGVGGVSTGQDVYDKIKAGASLVELYTAFTYEGPSLVPRIKRELAKCLEKDGYSSVAEAVGADHRKRK